jgi:hypothetical protein
VKHAASLRRESDRSEKNFRTFCRDNYIHQEDEQKLVFDKISRNLEIIRDHFNKITLDLLEIVHLNTFKQHPIDNAFGTYQEALKELN